jgi:hypothetical protein
VVSETRNRLSLHRGMNISHCPQIGIGCLAVIDYAVTAKPHGLYKVALPRLSALPRRTKLTPTHPSAERNSAASVIEIVPPVCSGDVAVCLSLREFEVCHPAKILRPLTKPNCNIHLLATIVVVLVAVVVVVVFVHVDGVTTSLNCGYQWAYFSSPR